MRIKIPQGPEKILEILENKGFEAFVVGGCVRDALLEREPQDWDVCTSAKPEETLEIFKREGYKAIPTGIQHGTVTIVDNGQHYEITTYRLEKEYMDYRRPSGVVFTENIEEDLSRRDFTINAMAYNHHRSLVDPHGGREDIQQKRIRCVGTPEDRFQEDALRMLRAVRFCCQLDFFLDRDTEKAIVVNSHLLKNISQERIREELNKILLADVPSKGIKDLIDSGLLMYIIPELLETCGFEQHNPHHDKDVFHHIMTVLDYTEKDLVLRLSALFHDIGKPKTFTVDEKGIGHFYGHAIKSSKMAESILKRLKYDGKTVEVVSTLVKEHMFRSEDIKPKTLKRFMNRVGIKNLDGLFKLQIADKKGSREDYDYSTILRVKDEADRILQEKEPLQIKDLAIGGKELMEMGVPQGKKIGKLLDELLEWVLENPKLNTREELIKFALGRTQNNP